MAKHCFARDPYPLRLLGLRLGWGPFHQEGLAPGSLVGVDDALSRRLVDPLHRYNNGSFGISRLPTTALALCFDRLESVLGSCAHLRTGGPVAQAPLLVLPVSLDLALDVCHR